MTHAQPTLRTERLTLRPFQATDAPDVQRLAGEWEVANTTLNIPHPYPDGAAEAWIATHSGHYESGKAVIFAITTRGDGALVGAVGLSVEPVHARGELGYWVARPHWAKGFATEAGLTIVAYGFETLALNRIEAVHMTRNPASGRVMVKLGMRLEGAQRERIRRSGQFEDVATYAILRAEWTAGRATLAP